MTFCSSNTFIITRYAAIGLMALLVLFTSDLTAQTTPCKCSQLKEEKLPEMVVIFSDSAGPFTGECVETTTYPKPYVYKRQRFEQGHLTQLEVYSPTRLNRVERFYLLPLGDTLLAERYDMNDEGDTIGVTTTYLSHQGTQKWSHVIQWYPKQFPNSKGTKKMECYWRYPRRGDWKGPPGSEMPFEKYYDSLGFYFQFYVSGTYRSWHTDGSLELEGTETRYDRFVSGSKDVYNQVKTGRWLRGDYGGRTRYVDEYDSTGMLLRSWVMGQDSTKPASRFNYSKSPEEIRMPLGLEAQVSKKGPCQVEYTYYFPSGEVSAESFVDAETQRFTYAWHQPGVPASVLCGGKQSRIFGGDDEREWDMNGKLTYAINALSERGDTILFSDKGEKGKVLLLRNPGVGRLDGFGDDSEWVKRLHNAIAVRRDWHSNGQLAREIHLRHGKRHGSWKEWTPDGTLVKDATYSRDLKVGDWVLHGHNGKLLEKGTYVNGIRNSRFSLHDTTGKTIWSNQYRMGRCQTGKQNFLTTLLDDQQLEKARNAKLGSALEYYLQEHPMGSALSVPVDSLVPYADLLLAIEASQLHGQVTHISQMDRDTSLFLVKAVIYSELKRDEINQDLTQLLEGSSVKLIKLNSEYHGEWRAVFSSEEVICAAALYDTLKSNKLRYSELEMEGVSIFGRHNSYIGIERQGDMVILKSGWGWGDCESGCINRQYYYHRVYADMTADLFREEGGSAPYWPQD